MNGNNKIRNIEIEVKFVIKDPDEIRLKLDLMGIVSPGSVFEKNHRYDDLDSSLLKSKRLLRLRCDQKNILTFKKPSSIKNTDFKINEEIEVELSDFDQMEIILKEIGFFKVQSYEKHRETFIVKDAKILIDTMPYGIFIEIEGSEEAIRNYTDILGLDWNKRITMNYLEIFANISKRLQLSFRDLTFENFDQISDSFCITASDVGLQSI